MVGPGNGHNLKWKKKAKEIGCTGKIYHENEFATPKWIKYCEQGCWWVKCYRRKNNLICKKCKSAKKMSEAEAKEFERSIWIRLGMTKDSEKKK